MVACEAYRLLNEAKISSSSASSSSAPHTVSSTCSISDRTLGDGVSSCPPQAHSVSSAQMDRAREKNLFMDIGPSTLFR